MDGSYSPSIADIAAVNRGYGYGGCNDGFGFGGAGIWLFAILALFWGGGFGGNRFGNGLDGRCATVEDINNTTNFARLENQVRANENLIQNGFTNLGNGICQLGYQLATDNGEIQREISECCCGINRNIDGVRYENAINTASINANTVAVGQKILDKMCENEKAAMAARIQQLELQQAMCGVVRYPNTASFAVGTPFNFTHNCGCGCGCGNF